MNKVVSVRQRYLQENIYTEWIGGFYTLYKYTDLVFFFSMDAQERFERFVELCCLICACICANISCILLSSSSFSLCQHLLHPPQLLVLLRQHLVFGHLLASRSTTIGGHCCTCSSPLGQPLTPEVLVVHIMGHLLQVLHVGDKHTPQLDEVAVLRVLDIHNAPGILPASHLLTGHLYHCVCSADCERNTLPQLSHLQFVFLIFVTVNIRETIDFDPILSDFLQNPFFQFLDLRHGKAVRFSNHRHYRYLVRELLHEVDVKWL